MRPWLTAVYLIVHAGRAAIVDTATNGCVDRVLAALAAKSVAPECVDYVILTHIHLDHAGGAGQLLSRLPRAMLCVHPRGVRHMADPSRLVASTVAVYGAERARAVYGDLVPVPPPRILATAEGTSIELAGRTLHFIETPGHARHHCCIVDETAGAVFAGDTFGLAYRELAQGTRRFVFPTTSPVQFDPDALHRSIARIVALRPRRVFVAHFGGVDEIRRLADDLHRLIDAHVALARDCAGSGTTRHAEIKAGLERLLRAEARAQSWPFTWDEVLGLFATDIELNAQGLGVWLDSQPKGPGVP